MTTLARLSFALTLLTPALASAQGDPENPSCEFDPETGVLTLLVAANPSSLKVLDDGRFEGTGGCPAEATVTTVETVQVIGGSIANGMSIRGSFSPGRTPETDGTSEIEFVVDLKGGADNLWVTSTDGDDLVLFTSYGIDVGGDGDKDVTIKGVETIHENGHEGNDVIDASRYAGPATLILSGHDGDDLVIGSAGNDQLYAGGVLDADEIRGGPGDDYIAGTGGDDLLVGGSGDDTFYQSSNTFGAGGDTIRGGSGIDKVDYSDRTVPVFVSLNGLRDDGAEGENDLIDSNVENVSAGSAADVLVGSAAGNTLSGGAGDDEIYGGGGDDLLRGQDGLDLLVGDEGNDTLRGGAGNDSLDGGAGVDAFFGEDGSDSFINDDGVAETVNCGAGIFDDPEPSTNDTFVACELI